MIGPEQAVDAINRRFGRHSGFRAAHAKGAFYRGSFTATPEAARLTRAAHMQGRAVEVTVRLSNASGDPRSPDYAPDVRGMATTFYLPDGSRTDISAQTAPRFPAGTPEAFMEFVRADEQGWARLWRLPLFLLRHPRALGGLRAVLAVLNAPPSYATCHYYAIHAFKWIDSYGGERYVRYRWLPEATAAPISKREAKERGPDYLQEEIGERLGRGAVRFLLQVQVAAEEDPVEDSTAVWPDERETFVAGTLDLTAPEERETGTEVLVFDPTRVTDGIELSDDPLLRFRSRAYSVSAERRRGARKSSVA